MKRITVCLLNWRRPENLTRIVAAFRRQNVGCDIFLWDNGEAYNRPTNAHSECDWVVQSSENKRCWPRWFMASQASTEYVTSWDDDLMPKDENFLQLLLSCLDKVPADRAVGIEGVVLRPEKLYSGSNSDGVPVNQSEVDIIKGRQLACRRIALAKVSMFPPTVTSEDDIAISGILSQGKPLQNRQATHLKSWIEELPDPHALWRQPGHFERRDLAVRTFFPWHR